MRSRGLRGRLMEMGWSSPRKFRNQYGCAATFFSNDEFSNHYFQGLIAPVSQVVSQQLQHMSAEVQFSLSAVRLVAAAIGLLQRVLIIDNKNSEKGSREENVKSRSSVNTVLLTPPSPILVGCSTFDLTDPS